MKIRAHHVLIAAVGVISAAAAVEQYYEHPTYGRGLQALASVIGAWLSL
ncbi:MAG: hypothetical protein JO293_03075 [Candidatus Eremiobacteraeota bacterium]|nr:hypothetical protein [Candidatus Eremiobacteraeota bacterium]MBV8222317.1 hypothetical protein [Candidatus Eremiobacteraeota bacterium]